MFLGVDACFKLKLKDRGFNDPELGTRLAYMVNEAAYQMYLNANWSRFVPGWRKMLREYKRDKLKPNPFEEPSSGRSAHMCARVFELNNLGR